MVTANMKLWGWLPVQYANNFPFSSHNTNVHSGQEAPHPMTNIPCVPIWCDPQDWSILDQQLGNHKVSKDDMPAAVP